MADIVWLLRNDCPCISDIGCAQELCNQAADEIERLKDGEARLRAALRAVDDEHGYGLPPETRQMIRAALEGRT